MYDWFIVSLSQYNVNIMILSTHSFYFHCFSVTLFIGKELCINNLYR